MQMDFQSLSVRVIFFSSFTKTEFRIILSFTRNGYGKTVDLLELEFTSYLDCAGNQFYQLKKNFHWARYNTKTQIFCVLYSLHYQPRYF